MTDTPTNDTLHPMVALMHRYVHAYTNAHDQTIYPELFEPDYTVNIGGAQLLRDESYGPAVRWLFDRAPGLGITVHELVLGDDALAMRFSEHAAMPTRDGRRTLTCWRGLGIYRWNGRRLVTNWVEQDFLARRRQMASGIPDDLEPPHLDPWMTTQPQAPNLENEELVRAMLTEGHLGEIDSLHLDDQTSAGAGLRELVVEPSAITVNELFSAGSHIGVHATVHGPYRGGLDGVDDRMIGSRAELALVGLLTIDEHTVRSAHIVTDREGLRGHLRKR